VDIGGFRAVAAAATGPEQVRTIERTATEQHCSKMIGHGPKVIALDAAHPSVLLVYYSNPTENTPAPNTSPLP
jgi:hypothetical protein